MAFPTTALLKRELLTTLRSRRSYMLLVVTTSLIFVIVGIFLYDLGDGRGFGGVATGNYVLGAISVGLYIAMLLCIPPMAASTIVSERTMGNYDLLMTSLIRPTGILFGKMAHIVGVYMLLVVAVLPLVGVCYFFVGVEWPQLLMVALALLVAAVALCSFGLYLSAVLQSTRSAVLGAYVLTALFQGMALLFILYTLEFLNITQSEIYFGYINPPEWVFPLFLPAMAIVTALDPAGANTTIFGYNMLIQCVWILVFTGLAAARLRRPWEPATTGATRDRLRGILRLRQPEHNRSLPPVPLHKNAMHWKELRSTTLGHGKARVILWLVFFAGCLALNLKYSDFRNPDHEVGYVVLIMQHLVMLFLAPAAIATAFAKEYERQNVDMLRVTLLSPFDIAWGKYRAALSMLLTLYSAALAALIVAAQFIWVPWHIFIYFVQEAILITFALSLGGAVGARFRRTGAALTGVYLTGFVLLAVVPWISFMLFGSMLRGNDMPPMVVAGLYPPMLLFPWEPGERQAAIGYWAIFFVSLYSLGLFYIYWRAAVRNLARETDAGE
jgi:hypothetical protein